MSLRDRLAAAGHRLQEAEAERAAAMTDLAALVREAAGEVPIAEIARLGQVSRPTVYKLLATEPSGPEKT